MAVKMIKIGNRECFFTNKHVVPIDLYCGSTFYYNEAGDELTGAVIEKASPGGAVEMIQLGGEEAQQFKTMLARMVT